MKIYDISREVLSSPVYPGDPKPRVNAVCRIDNGQLYNLSQLSMCVHNGTHIDAPFHFINEGRTVDKIPLENLIGNAFVKECQGEILKDEAEDILRLAREFKNGSEKRILIKGKATLTADAAEVFKEAKILLFGNESQSVGPIDSPMEVHRILLSENVVLLEGICLDEVFEGTYLLNAAPLNLAGLDGSPCRAVLLSLD